MQKAREVVYYYLLKVVSFKILLHMINHRCLRYLGWTALY